MVVSRFPNFISYIYIVSFSYNYIRCKQNILVVKLIKNPLFPILWVHKAKQSISAVFTSNYHLRAGPKLSQSKQEILPVRGDWRTGYGS
jgi:hypothetical protein